MLRPMDLDDLRRSFASAHPFPFVKIENFLEPAAAMAIATAYPPFDVAEGQGRTFHAVNEKKKVQITDTAKFPALIARLNDALASPRFLSDLSYITGIPNILADAELVGGGMHITGPGGRLDVHVDFNYVERRKLHRRLNLLLYLNPIWDETWGGQIQFWDTAIKTCEASFAPIMNRCVIFETSDISYHGVTPISPSAASPRQSFATYYYTREAPAHWTGTAHGTIFKARPDERFRKFVAMPAENAQRAVLTGLQSAKRAVKAIIQRP